MNIRHNVEDIRDLHDCGSDLQREEIATLFREIDRLRWQVVDAVWVVYETVWKNLNTACDEEKILWIGE